MERKLILRGVLVGALAGLLAFVFARVFAESLISRAVAYESGRDAAQVALDKAAGLPTAPNSPEIFSRGIQANIGIGTGMILFGAAMGTLVAVAYSICLGRTGKISPRSLALLVSLGGFLAFYVIPFLKYPANPPSIGHPDTIKERTGLYLVMLVAGVALLPLAVVLGQRLASRFGNWNSSIMCVGALVVVIGTLMALLPPLGMLASNVAQYGSHATETPLPLTAANGSIVYPGFPADDLWQFRLYSLLAQAILWAGIGLGFGPLAEKVLTPAGQRNVQRNPAIL